MTKRNYIVHTITLDTGLTKVFVLQALTPDKFANTLFALAENHIVKTIETADLIEHGA